MAPKKVSVKDALSIITDHIQPTEILRVYTNESYGMVLGEDILAPYDSPDFTRAAMDGYAITDLHSGRYRIVHSMDELKEGCAIRINTGNPLPEHVRAVVELESVRVTDGYIELDIEPEEYRVMNLKGSEFKKGDKLIERGNLINTRILSLLSYSGIVRVNVHRKPIVGVITTGDEVVFPGEETTTGNVFNSNFYILKGLLNKWGAETIYFGHAMDSIQDMEEKISKAIARSDMVITTGGSSKGNADYTKDVLSKLGVNILFEKTAIKPGKPMLFGNAGDKTIFGMPGWPSALFSTAYVYIKPAIYKLSGRKDDKIPLLQGITTKPIRSRKGKTYLIRVSVDYKNGIYYCTPKKPQTTDNFYTVATADGLIVVDENLGNVEEGTNLPLIMFDD